MLATWVELGDAYQGLARFFSPIFRGQTIPAAIDDSTALQVVATDEDLEEVVFHRRERRERHRRQGPGRQREHRRNTGRRGEPRAIRDDVHRRPSRIRDGDTGRNEGGALCVRYTRVCMYVIVCLLMYVLRSTALLSVKQTRRGNLRNQRKK